MSFCFTNLYFLIEGQGLSMENLPDGPFFTVTNHHYLIRIPSRCVLVRCDYDGDYDKDHQWKNPISGKIHRGEHPCGEKFGDTYFEFFYEITPIEDPFEEGYKWDHETNTMERVEKPERTSVWNSFRQCWEPECTDCLSSRIKYDFSNENFDSYFPSEELHFFFEVYCKCCVCKHCGIIHTYTCSKMCRI
jgi:hypothetical protein